MCTKFIFLVLFLTASVWAAKNSKSEFPELLEIHVQTATDSDNESSDHFEYEVSYDVMTSNLEQYFLHFVPPADHQRKH